MLTDLEAMVDRNGLFAVLDALSGVCGLKAEHIQANWQADKLAHRWEQAERVLERAAASVLNLRLGDPAKR